MSANTISLPTTAAMLACVLYSYILLLALSECVRVQRHIAEPNSALSNLSFTIRSKRCAKHKEELFPLLIPCALNDIVTISVPIIYETRTLYYLHRPNGDVTQLDITPPTKKPNREDYHEVMETYLGEEFRVMYAKNDYKLINVNLNQKIDSKTNDVFTDNGTNIVIGPLGEDDHGNWVLSLYTEEKRICVEWFQVITIEIFEAVPSHPQNPELRPGDTLVLGFAYPIKNISSCQLTAPPSSFDRYYERAPGDTCTFILRNVTTDDEGYWGIRGVSKIVFGTRTRLKVRNKIT